MFHLSLEAQGHRARRFLPALLCLLLCIAVLPGSAAAAVTEPSLRLFGPSGEITVYRYGQGQPVYMDLGVLVGAMGAPLELRAQRASYSEDPTLVQVLRGPGEQEELRSLDPTFLDGWQGLADFFEITFSRDGAEILSTTQAFCPGGWQRERIDDSGPDVPIYPSGCYANPFTKGQVWGIDQGWAVGSSGGGEPPSLAIPNGLYSVTIRIAQAYVDAFGIDPALAGASLTVRVRTMRDFECGRECIEGAPRRAYAQQTRAQAPVVSEPDPATLPDLIALPSWGISVDNRRVRSTLTFGATVWNGGASDLVVEGFRRSDEAVMDAFQFFYEGREVVGKAPAGELAFDQRDGHDHWHFKQFAAYSLLDAEGNEVRKSRKEAFCLAPTDAIDTTIPNAEWNPGSIGLATACGGPSSIWVREILPLGWGDTYFQGIPGQSFWITNLPNGTYFIKIEANPGGMLHETTASNNVELRQIVLRGRPGNRRVEVPPWNGIDTEGLLGER